MCFVVMQEVLLRLQQLAQEHRQPVKLLHVGTRKISFSKNFFLPIHPVSAKTVAFVDGGNAEIIRAPHLSVHFIRTYAAVYNGMQRMARQLREAFVIIHLKPNKDSFVYKVELIGADLNIPEIDFQDSNLCAGEHVTPQAIADVVRHCLEWQLLDLQETDCVVRDGALDDCPQDKFRTAKESRIMQIGLSKTTTALTDTGVSAPFYLSQAGPEGSWVYAPTEQNPVSIGFARLHAKSKRVFRLDVKNGTLPEAAGILAPYCADASFVGYPYGLVDADLMAAVKQQEAQYLRQLFLAKCGKMIEHIEQAADAHDVLNAMH